MAYYPYKLRDEDTGWGQHIEWRIKFEEDYKKRQKQAADEEKEKEQLNQAKILALREEQKLKYVGLPREEELFKVIDECLFEDIKKIKPCYILNTKFEIVEVVGNIGRVSIWLQDKLNMKKSPGRTTIFEYIRHKSAYAGEYYIVPATMKNLEEFYFEKIV
ncbi:hypothetical protein COM13_12925 [Bacillus pseudomycoides]|uniref:hypothetical protein n=1 Tax=Bacillus pseudomycoides TaxID=64104 RepID=UPI000BEC9918|nr:hypothetical protein [Bacillus pseudomycoides]PDX99381.1 hypothetical protein COO07_17145 [Bacillus pseudomycoides]PEK83186.1 hypothetical protein CN597_00520 [Bacillus pseudomycoides]PEN09010.1 hypothetical protein CN640_12805 [Bacillus pseudomycoides]PGB88877.1 hypothetical protein COM13_12925 [Bacillus pseudomycoides]